MATPTPHLLNGKVAIVTGASSGIGRSTAVHFTSLGVRLTITGRNAAALNETTELCKAAGAADVVQVVGDLTDEDVAGQVVKKCLGAYGQLDVLVNNAGIVEKGSIENTSMDSFDRVMNINVRSIFHLTSLAVPHLISTKGAIVNVSSVNGLRSFPGVLAYCMSKSAVDQFTACVAIELASKGVRVNSVNPGVITTNIHKRGGMNDEEYAAFLERSKTTHALGRVGSPEEVAQAIAFLAGSQSSFVTGALLPIDGGRHALCPR